MTTRRRGTRHDAQKRGAQHSGAKRKGDSAWAREMNRRKYPTGYKRGGIRAVSIEKIMFERVQPTIIEIALDTDVKALLAEIIRTESKKAEAGFRFVTPDKIEVVRLCDDKITGYLTVVH